MNAFKEKVRRVISHLTPAPKGEAGITPKGMRVVEAFLAAHFEEAGYEVGDVVYWRSLQHMLAGRGVIRDKRQPVVITETIPESSLPAKWTGDLRLSLEVTACGIPKAYQEYLDQHPEMTVTPFPIGKIIDAGKADISREYHWKNKKGYEKPPWELQNKASRK